MSTVVYSGDTGLWTPTIQDASLSDAESQTYVDQYGSYTRNGDLVHVQGRVRISSLGNLEVTEQVRLAGLPFTANSNANNIAVVNISNTFSLAMTAGISVVGKVEPGTTYCLLQQWSATTGTGSFLISELSASGAVSFSIQYKV